MLAIQSIHDANDDDEYDYGNGYHEKRKIALHRDLFGSSFLLLLAAEALDTLLLLLHPTSTLRNDTFMPLQRVIYIA